MSASKLMTRPVSQIELAPGSIVTLREVTWPEFEAFLDELSDSRPTRIAYSQGTLEIMAPLPKHERAIVVIVDLVKTLLRLQRRPWESLRTTTFKREGIAGVEPDDYFYIQNYRAVIGNDRIALAVDPPPDLAIESDLTSKIRTDSYLALKVPELWIDASEQLTIYRLEGGCYIKSSVSQIFPDVAIAHVIPQFVSRANEVGTSQALQEFEEWLA